MGPARAPGWLVVAVGALACFPDADKLRAVGVNPTGTGGGGPGGSSGADGSSSDGTGDGAGTGGAGGAGGAGGSTGGAGGTGGGGTGGTGGTGGMQTKAQACAAYADASAAVMARCAPVLLQVVYGSEAMAKQRLRLLCRYVDLPGANFPKRPVAPCVAAMGALSCEDFFDDRIPAACQAAGDYAAGARCTGGDQCQSGFCDVAMPSGVCGTCQILPAAGASCYQGVFCRRGLLCSPSGICAAPGELGADCDDNKPCRQTLYCYSGSCSHKGEAGGLCFDRADCDETKGAICNTNTNTCVSYRAGTTCGIGQDGTATACTASGFCLNTGACLPPSGENGNCDDENGPQCLSPARCVSGTCKFPPYEPTCVQGGTAAVGFGPAALSGAVDRARSRDSLRGRSRDGAGARSLDGALDGALGRSLGGRLARPGMGARGGGRR